MERTMLALPAWPLAITDAPQPPFWGDLEPGPNRVGFKIRRELDRSRLHAAQLPTGTAYAEDTRPRPVLVNVSRWAGPLRPVDGDGCRPSRPVCMARPGAHPLKEVV